jgi:hypothetical protein
MLFLVSELPGHPGLPGWVTLANTPSIIRQKSFHTDKKENIIFLVYKEIQMGAVAKSHMRKGFLIFEEMRKYLAIYEEAVSHI